jgi:hypothetical protein
VREKMRRYTSDTINMLYSLGESQPLPNAKDSIKREDKVNFDLINNFEFAKPVV